MSDRNKYRFNLVAWITVSLTLCTSSVRGLWYLSDVAHNVQKAAEEIQGIRSDMKTARDDINNLKDRTTRLEEHAKISGEFIDHTKGFGR